MAPWLLLIAVLALLALRLWRYMTLVEPNRVEITRHEVRIRDLPAQLEGVVIAQVSDLHITERTRNQDAISDSLRSVRADLYVLTGDMIYLQSGIPAFLKWMDRLGEHLQPAICILGNAEWKPFVDKSPLLEALKQRSVPVLINETLQFSLRGTTLQIVGVDDPHTRHHDFELAFRDADPGRSTLLLCHSPDGATFTGPYRIDLMLSGHTHGGQIRLPLIGALMHNTNHAKRLDCGWFSGEVLERRARGPVGKTLLYVSRGLGTSRIPARLLCRPELALFTLRRVTVDKDNPNEPANECLEGGTTR